MSARTFLLVAALIIASGLNPTMTKSSDNTVSRPVCSDPIQTQLPTFSSRVETVPVDVLVMQDGHPLHGLRAADFELRDNGVLQRVDLVGVENIPLNLVLAFDISESVAGTRLGQLRSASDVLLDELRKEDLVGLVTFNHNVRPRSELTPDRDAIRAALEKVQAAGATALYDGTYLGLMTGEPATGRRRLQIVFSDGFDTCSWLQPDAVIQAARRLGVLVYAVSVAEAGRSPAFLRDVCDATGGRLMEIESTWNLSSAFLDALDEVRQRYLVSYSPQGVAREGWHRLEVRVKGRKVVVKARAGYFAGS